MASGGVTARNTRQGFRSEYIVKYIFSAFGTTVDVSAENDLGLDLLCNLTSFQGHLIIYKSTFGIQVKSKGTPFKYSGKQATTWLSKMEFPFLLAEVDKANSKIKVFSTWGINKYLINIHTDDEGTFPENVEFITSDDDGLQPPNSETGVIPVGKPILDFHYSDIDNKMKLNQYYEVLSEWLQMDNENYKLRRAGVSRSYGFNSWTTNQKPSLGHGFDLFYTFSPFHNANINKLIIHSLTVQGMYYKASSDNGNNEHFKLKYNSLRKFVVENLLQEMNDFEKDIFKNDL